MLLGTEKEDGVLVMVPSHVGSPTWYKYDAKEEFCVKAPIKAFDSNITVAFSK